MRKPLILGLVGSLLLAGAARAGEDEARLLAQKALRDGERLLSEGRPSEAARLLSDAQAALARLPRGDSEKTRWERTLGLLTARASEGLEAERAARALAQRRAAEAEALRERALLQESVRRRGESLLRQGREALESGRWDQAEGLASAASGFLPGDLRPDAVAGRARELRHLEAASRLAASAREETACLREDAREQGVPYARGVLRYPDDWAATHRGRQEEALGLHEEPWKQALRDRLGRRVHYRFEEVAFQDALRFLESQGGVTVNIDRLAQEAVPGLAEKPVRLSSPEEGTTLESALNALARLNGVAWTMRDETLVITTEAGLEEEEVYVHYDLRDLMHKLKDFPGPKVTLTEGGKGNEFEFPEEDREDDTFDPDELVEFIQNLLPEGKGRKP